MSRLHYQMVQEKKYIYVENNQIQIFRWTERASTRNDQTVLNFVKVLTKLEFGEI